MDRRDILAERPVEKGRGFMPGVSVDPATNPVYRGADRATSGRQPRPGRDGAQTHRAFERLTAVLGHAGAKFDNAVKQLAYVTDIDAYNASGRAERGKFSAPPERPRRGSWCSAWPTPPC